jgi:transposase-like protein
MSAAGRTLSDAAVAGMTEAGARALFTRLRWPHGRCCPRCGGKRHYPIATRRIFKCSGCSHQFSVTSGTIWQAHKFSLKRILLGIYYFCQSPKGISSATLAMIMGTSPNSALIFTHRVREALFRHNSGLVLSGDIEIDGIYFSKYRRRPNIGRRSVPTLRTPNVEGRCALTMVQRNGPAIVLPVEGETSAAVLAAVQKHVAPGSRLFTDDLPTYQFLNLWFDLKQVNHGVCYSDGEACTNQAESLNARIRRGQANYHRFSSGPDFELYLSELAFRHGARDMDAMTLWETVIGLTLAHGPSERFAGYWQGVSRQRLRQRTNQ